MRAAAGLLGVGLFDGLDFGCVNGNCAHSYASGVGIARFAENHPLEGATVLVVKQVGKNAGWQGKPPPARIREPG